MDPAPTFCPNLACPARGRTDQGNIRIHSCKDKRFMGTECHKTFGVTTRHSLLLPADRCGDGEPRGDADGSRLSTASDRRGVWL
jgi:hypothetical protein